MFKERAERKRLNLGLRLVAVAALVLATVGPVFPSEASTPNPDQPLPLLQWLPDPDASDQTLPVSPREGLLQLHNSTEDHRQVTLNLPGTTITTDLARNPKTSLGFTGWTSQSPNLEVTLVENGKIAMARIRSGSQTWLLTPPDNQYPTHRVTQITSSPVKTDDLVLDPASFPIPTIADQKPKMATQSQLEPQPTHRELVVITQEALNRSTPEVISATVALEMELHNQVLANHQIDTRYEIGGTMLLDVPYETTNPNFHIQLMSDILGGVFYQQVFDARTTAQADSVTVYTSELLPYCGIAFKNDPTQSSSAYWAISLINSKANLLCEGATKAHEKEHEDVDADHAIEDGGQGGVKPYANGYKIPNVARDVMAYPCAPDTPCPQVLYLSSPDVSVADSAGTLHPLGNADYADVARATRELVGYSTTFWEQIAPTPLPTHFLYIPAIFSNFSNN